jgi:FAD/FMN-containing dehydrogenase/Fe-S oxidoreductase
MKQPDFTPLTSKLQGAFYSDQLMKALYATDASIYREYPLAVCLPETVEDIKHIISFVRKNGLSIIPRAAGTSLAGQCVGTGIVVDISRMNKILEVNVEESWVKVQPGVVRDELNAFLKPLGLYFGPNTSTANRCMMAGMVGNNSCGTTSIVYGSTREHTMELDVVLSNGSEVKFGDIDKDTFERKRKQDTLEGQIYQHLFEELSNTDLQSSIRKEFPKPSIHRRNTGYAVDFLLESEVFTNGGGSLNICNLLCGSEGTLAFTTGIKLHVDPLPPAKDVVLCAHFGSLNEAMKAVVLAMEHKPSACELMDDTILQMSKQNITQLKNRFFVNGDPEALLTIEFRGDTKEEAEAKADKLIADFKKAGFGYDFPKIFGPRTKAVWDLRSAGLGILANIPGDAKAVACIEDTAVDIQDLPEYIDEFAEMLASYGQTPIYYAHAGAGEIHLRPVLNLKDKEDRQTLYDITEASAKLVKKYNGALSGEHGDGRLRAEFLPMMVGEQNYELFKRVKQKWDPNKIFNPEKIVDAPKMNTVLRYDEGQDNRKFDTVYDYSDTNGFIGAAEKCTGSGDCRKLDSAGGTMCPSYRATRNEKDSTRGRANALREFLSRNEMANPFEQQELYEVLELCLSCKGCTAECPSNVDMAKLKAEFLHQYYKTNPVPFRSKFFAQSAKLNAFGSYIPGVANFFLKNSLTGGLLKKVLKVAPQRPLPLLHRTTLFRWYQKNKQSLFGGQKDKVGTLYLFCDEVVNFNDAALGIKAVQLLAYLGYDVKMLPWTDSARVHISKGLMTEAKKMAEKNVKLFYPLISEKVPLVGIEPSGILGFRDEFPSLLRGELKEKAKALAPFALTIEEFLHREIEKGNIQSESFTNEVKHIHLHGHCHQKSLSGQEHAAFIMSLPEHYSVEIIPSGCCGMAGSFGFEKEHYELSLEIGEMVLFPAVRAANDKDIIAAPGASCRQQIADGAGREAVHPVEVLWEAAVKVKE